MSFKVGDIVVCIDIDNALCNSRIRRTFCSTSDLADGLPAKVLEIIDDELFVLDTGADYNQKAFILYKRPKKIIKQFGIVKFLESIEKST